MKSLALAVPVLVAAAFAGAAPAAAPGPTGASQTIHVRAHIDGRSWLILDADTAQWQHFDFAAPGRESCQVNGPSATYIDAQEWWPQWPDVPDCENRDCGGCFSDVLTGLVPGVAETAVSAWIVPIVARGSCRVIESPSAANGYRVVVELDDNYWSEPAWYEVLIVLEDTVGESYCVSTPNSTGQAARISASGSSSVVSNDTWLRARGCPGGSVGMFIYGAHEMQMPFANGYLCINPLEPGLLRILPGALVGADGMAQAHLDLTSLPQAGAITAGSTWCFQFWFRDPKAGGAGVDLTDGLRLTFVD